MVYSVIVGSRNENTKKAIKWLIDNNILYEEIEKINSEQISNLILSYNLFIDSMLNKKHSKYKWIMDNIKSLSVKDVSDIIDEDFSLLITPIVFNFRGLIIGFRKREWEEKILKPENDKYINYLDRYNKNEQIIPYCTDEQNYDRDVRLSLAREYNNLSPMDDFGIFQLKKQLFGFIGDNTDVKMPFYSSWGGKNVYIGDNSFINFNASFIDDGNIFIGEKTYVGPNTNFSTINHPLTAEERENKYLIVKDIYIEDNVWIGANSVILPGVRIGSNTVIGAGSVVTKDIPSDSVAFGNPCKVVKKNIPNRITNNNNNVVVAMSCNEAWYKYLVVAVFSLLKFNKNVKKLYLFLETDNIEEVKYLKEIRDTFNVEFQLFNYNNIIDGYLSYDSPNRESMFTDFSFARLILADYINEERVIYIDTDAVVRGDISHLWNYDMTDYYVMGVKDYGVTYDNHLNSLNLSGKYINSGFVCFNLKKIREDNIILKWFDVINTVKLKYPDQDALNIVCTDHELYISSIYNYIYGLTLDVLNTSLIKVFHYAGYKYYWIADRVSCEEWYDSEEMFYKEIVNNI